MVQYRHITLHITIFISINCYVYLSFSVQFHFLFAITFLSSHLCLGREVFCILPLESLIFSGLIFSNLPDNILQKHTQSFSQGVAVKLSFLKT